MQAPATTEQRFADPWWAPCLAALVPFVVYAVSADPHAYWLDSGEFTAAAIDLDIPHPPGHPLSCLWGKLFTWLPLGPLPYRVALGQAVATTLALWCLQRALARSLTFVGLNDVRARSLLSIGSVWIVAGSYAFWFQSVRAEVYALQAMLICFAFERLVKLACEPERSDARPFYVATVSLGLGLANHHVMAFFAIPALLHALVTLTRAQQVRPFLWGAGTGALGLVTYAYLPLRASNFPPMDLGHPVSPSSIAWVVSARVYARNFGSEAVQPMGERFADLVVIIVDNLLAPTLMLGVLGLYVLLRRRDSWGLAYVWGAAAIVSLAGRAWLGPVRSNPDMLGYMMPGLAALVALATCFVGVLLAQIEASLPKPVLLGVGALCISLGGYNFVKEKPRCALADFHATDDFDDARRRELPEGALVIAVTPELAFRHWQGEATERLRPDLTLVPVPFLGYPGTADALIEKHPELETLVRSYRATDQLSVRALLELAETRPVLVEGDGDVTLSLFPYLFPEGLLFRVLPGPKSRDALQSAAAAREQVYERLRARVGDNAQEIETRRQLLWLCYVDALYYAFHGVRDAAARATQRGLALEPQAPELLALLDALRSGPERPLDIRAFLPHPN